MSGLRLWGGHECTVNRVGDRFHDQTVVSGHERRPEDIDRFAELGLERLRYPVLWERIAPDRPDVRDFAWTDARLNRIRELGMKPIAGLIHHGSGPRYTHLLDDGFAAGLADHARAVAERHPWIEDWTPVNEPLTTARFSALYGLWYPHARDMTSLWRALLNQIDATRLAMREIRKVRPDARLIQTEDLGWVHATRALEHQAVYENHRKWLTWDLLCGRVGPDHPLWLDMARAGFADRLRAIADDPCPPDVIGVNHYLSSERLLDHRIERYPAVPVGGNGRETYVDVEAVRAAPEGALGWEALLLETWRRYGRTLAVTEAHNGCTREEQMRWVWEAWSAAERLRAEGVRIEAVTAWSLLGSYDWNRLLTEFSGWYEPGVYDLRGGEPRPTAMVAFLRDLAAGRGAERHALALSQPGWWRREDIRLLHPSADGLAEPRAERRDKPAPLTSSGPVLITGASGTLGRAFARACAHRGLPHVLTDRATLRLEDAESVRAAVERFRPAMVINAAGYVRVDEAEGEAGACRAANAVGPQNLARACRRLGVPLATFSSDLVFDGSKGAPYVESDPVAPLNVYGRSKAQAEAAVLESGAEALVVRTAAFFSPHDVYNFAHQVLEAVSQGRRFRAASDMTVSPTYVPDLVDATLDLMLDGETGLRHLANAGRASWAEFATILALRAGFDPGLVEPVPAARLGMAAPRPREVVLGTERGVVMPTLESAVERFLGGWREGVGRTRVVCPPEEAILEEAAE